MFRRKGMLWAGILLVAIGLLTGCSSSDGAAESETSETVEQESTEEEKESETKENSKDEKESETKGNSEDEKETDDHVINVSAFEMGYDPKEITLNKGEEYELIMSNDGDVFHDLTQNEMDVEITYMSDMADHPDSTSLLDRIIGGKKVHASGSHDGGHDDGSKNIHMNATSGQTVRIKFIPQEKGEFEFFCSVPGHKEAGMIGNFIVE